MGKNARAINVAVSNREYKVYHKSLGALRNVHVGNIIRDADGLMRFMILGSFTEKLNIDNFHVASLNY